MILFVATQTFGMYLWYDVAYAKTTEEIYTRSFCHDLFCLFLILTEM